MGKILKHLPLQYVYLAKEIIFKKKNYQ